MTWYCVYCNTGFKMASFVNGAVRCPVCCRTLRPTIKRSIKRRPRSERFPWLTKGTAGRLVRVAERNDWVCGICGKPVDADAERELRPTLDHIRPRSRGGGDEEENLQLAHSKCNTEKSDTWPYLS